MVGCRVEGHIGVDGASSDGRIFPWAGLLEHVRQKIKALRPSSCQHPPLVSLPGLAGTAHRLGRAAPPPQPLTAVPLRAHADPGGSLLPRLPAGQGRALLPA